MTSNLLLASVAAHKIMKLKSLPSLAGRSEDLLRGDIQHAIFETLQADSKTSKAVDKDALIEELRAEIRRLSVRLKQETQA